jgi:hypothetical protein
VASARFDSAFRAGLDAARTLDSLDDIGRRLDELASLVHQARASQSETHSDLSTRIDALVRTINSAADRALGSRTVSDAASVTYSRAATPQIPPPALFVSGVSSNIERLRAFGLVPSGGHVDVDVQIITSAQQAGFYLSFGGDNLNLSAAAARFEIEIAGSRGVRALSFASGTQVSSIADAINAFTDVTGVGARLSSDPSRSDFGIRLISTEFGDDHFVSVRIVNAGGINTAQAYAGVYSLRYNAANEAYPASPTPFSAATNTVTDSGQDIAGVVNGRVAQGAGRSLYAVTPNVLAQFRLTEEAAQRLGSFRAFTIHRRPAAAGASSDEPPVDPPAFSDAPRPELLPAQRADSPPDLSRLAPRIDTARDALSLARDAVTRHVAESIRPIIDAHLGSPAATPPATLDPERVRALLSR